MKIDMNAFERLCSESSLASNNRKFAYMMWTQGWEDAEKHAAESKAGEDDGWKAQALQHLDTIAKMQTEIDRMTILHMHGKCGKQALTPTEEMCKAARGFIMGLDLVHPRSWRNMHTHLEMGGYPTLWSITDKAKHNPNGHITKWDVAECIYLLMTASLRTEEVQEVGE